MSRDEVVLLVSRALSLLMAISALIDGTYLPLRLMSLHHYSMNGGMFLPSGSDSYLANSYRADVGLLLLRMAIYLLFALGFWNCGPRIRQLLLPSSREDKTLL